MNINERIRHLRKNELKLTQQDFSSKLNISRSNMGNIETGEVSVTDRTISSICREFNVNETWLRTGEGEMFEELTEQQKILKYTGLLLKNKDSTVAKAIQTLIITYEQLDDASKATLEKIALQYMDNLKKSQ